MRLDVEDLVRFLADLENVSDAANATGKLVSATVDSEVKDLDAPSGSRMVRAMWNGSTWKVTRITPAVER